jgi:hypothetical protein
MWTSKLGLNQTLEYVLLILIDFTSQYSNLYGKAVTVNLIMNQGMVKQLFYHVEIELGTTYISIMYLPS